MEVFVDTTHLVAVFREEDDLHDSALKLGRAMAQDRASFVTTTLVIAEFLAAVSRSGAASRLRCTEYVAAMRGDPSVVIVELNDDLFDRAFELYRSRPDKRYSLTDCASMCVCSERGISDVLTSDRDFEHEGFRALLRRPTR